MKRLTSLLGATALLLVLGCGIDDPGDDGPAAGGGVGAPLDNGGDKEALGSPIKVPKITLSQGQPIDDVRADLEKALKKLCGGDTLCVTVKVKQGEDEVINKCSFETTDPAPGKTIKRGSTLWMLTGAAPCEDVQPEASPAG